MTPKSPDLTPHSEPTVLELREPADRTGNDTIIRQRFNETDTPGNPTLGYFPEHQQLIEEEIKKTAERDRQTTTLRSKFKVLLHSRYKTILTFVLGGLIGMAGGFQLNFGNKTIRPPDNPLSEPNPEMTVVLKKPEQPPIEISRELLKAELFKNKGRPKEALAIVDELLTKRPDDLYLLYAKAQILESSGRKWKALNLLEEILKKDDGDESFQLIRRHRNALKNRLKGVTEE